MAVDAGTKRRYNDRISEQKKAIAEIDKDIAAIKKAMGQNEKLQPFFYIGIVSKMLRQINLNLDMNDMSERMMGIKNNNYLDTAKRMVGKIFQEIEPVVTMNVDAPLNHNREELDKLKPFTPKQRLNFYKHIQKTIQRLIKGYGESTKWKWSFPELWGKLAITLKNMTDYREMQAIRDPREEFFYDRQELLNTVKETLFDASSQYRSKFEISTKSTNDLVYAMKMLEDLRRIASMTGDMELSKKCKSGIESYKARIAVETKKKKGKK
ncbi:MAG: hypothetical protein ABUK01_01890 [Leptospirales bacterium]